MSIIASVPPTDHGWLGAISKNAQAAADKHDDVDFELLQAADADSQAQQIEQAIVAEAGRPRRPAAGRRGPDAGRAEGRAAGIRVVNVDRLFTAPDAATATILGDNYQIGVLAANYIADQLKCKGNVVEIQGLAGISVTTDRTKGFTDTIKQKCPGGGIKIVASQPGDFNPDKGLTVMENILQAQSDIDAVYTHDDDMAQGVVQAIRNAGRDDEMFLTGVGGSQDAMKQIKEGGLYRATFLYNPNMAASAVNMARLIGLGRGLLRARPAGGPAAGGRSCGGRHEGQRRRLRAVRVRLSTERGRAARRRSGVRRAAATTLSPWKALSQSEGPRRSRSPRGGGNDVRSRHRGRGGAAVVGAGRRPGARDRGRRAARLGRRCLHGARGRPALAPGARRRGAAP